MKCTFATAHSMKFARDDFLSRPTFSKQHDTQVRMCNSQQFARDSVHLVATNQLRTGYQPPASCDMTINPIGTIFCRLLVQKFEYAVADTQFRPPFDRGLFDRVAIEQHAVSAAQIA